MKTQELIKQLKGNGCYIIRHGKRHDIWFSPISGAAFPIPRHKAEIPNGTLNSIQKAAHISI